MASGRIARLSDRKLEHPGRSPVDAKFLASKRAWERPGPEARRRGVIGEGKEFARVTRDPALDGVTHTVDQTPPIDDQAG
jgi:hypothetical protein